MGVTIDTFENKKVVLWGIGREGMAAAALIRRHWPDLPLVFSDDNPDLQPMNGLVREQDFWVAGAAACEAALMQADIVIKSPGISLYRPIVSSLIARGVAVTSLLNLWIALPRRGRTIAVTGSKGKSTTASLISHMLGSLGHKVELIGNIGVPPGQNFEHEFLADFCVVEVSSYQAAQFDGCFDFAALTGLEQEHLDWHGTLERYYKDKLNLLSHARRAIAPSRTRDLLGTFMPDVAAKRAQKGEGWLERIAWAHEENGLRPHFSSNEIMDGSQSLGVTNNTFLARPHNLLNLSTALCVMHELGLDLRQALRGADTYQGLPHRQQELGIIDGVLYVDDSISTTPQAAIAALSVWRDRDLSLIVGGFDRGIDYGPLTNYLQTHNLRSVVTMGPSGARIRRALIEHNYRHALCHAETMQEAVDFARQHTRQGGVILLSPAAPSYGLFKDFSERGRAFAQSCGVNPTADQLANA